MEKLKELAMYAIELFLNSGADDDIACVEDVTWGNASTEQLAAVVLMRKVFSIFLMSIAKAGLIDGVEDNEIPWLYGEECVDEYKEEIFPRREGLMDWVIYNDRVIEAFVMPVIKKYGWKEVLLLRERESADEEDIPEEFKKWIRDEVESVYELAYEEVDEDCPQYFIPEGTGFAAVFYENELFSKLLFIGKSIEGKGYSLDSLLDEEMLSIYQRLAGYHFSPFTRVSFSFDRKWDNEKCYHCLITQDTTVANEYGYDYLEGFSIYKYVNPCLLFDLPAMDAGMKKLLPVMEELMRKLELDELNSLRSVA